MDMLLKNSKFLITNQHLNAISFFELEPPLFSLGLLVYAYLCVLFWSYHWSVHDLWLTLLTFGIAHLN